MENQNQNNQAAGDNAAANNQTNGQDQGQKEQPSAIDYSKIQAMIDKGTAQKENAILKSYFEQQGLTEEDAKAAIAAYKTQQAKKSEDQKNTFANMQAENEKLKQEILNNNIHASAAKIGAELGIDEKYINDAIQLADFKEVVDEKGAVKEDKIRESLDAVVKRLPALKKTEENNNGFKIGANNDNNNGAAAPKPAVPVKRWNRFN